MTMRTRLVHAMIALLLVCMPAASAHPGGPDTPGDRVLFPAPAGVILVPQIGFMLNLHAGSFHTSENGQTCCGFDGGSGWGGVVGGRAFIDLTADWTISPRIAWENRTGTFTSDDILLPFRDENNQLAHARLEQRYALTLGTLAIDALAVHALPWARTYAGAGLSARLLLSRHASGSETIVAPQSVTFTDGTVEHTFENDGPAGFPLLALHVRAGAGAWIDVPAGFTINPELLFDMPLAADGVGGDWRMFAVQFTVGVRFEL